MKTLFVQSKRAGKTALLARLFGHRGGVVKGNPVTLRPGEVPVFMSKRDPYAANVSFSPDRVRPAPSAPIIFELLCKRVLMAVPDADSEFLTTKKQVSDATGIPVDVAGAVLRHLCNQGTVRLTRGWNTDDGMAHGSGYIRTAERKQHGPA